MRCDQRFLRGDIEMLLDVTDAAVVVHELVIVLRGTVAEDAGKIMDELLSFQIEMLEDFFREFLHIRSEFHLYILAKRFSKLIKIIPRERDNLCRCFPCLLHGFSMVMERERKTNRSEKFLRNYFNRSIGSGGLTVDHLVLGTHLINFC